MSIFIIIILNEYLSWGKHKKCSQVRILSVTEHSKWVATSAGKVIKAANFLRDVPYAGALGVFRRLDHPTFRRENTSYPSDTCVTSQGSPNHLPELVMRTSTTGLCAVACSRRTSRLQIELLLYWFQEADQSSDCLRLTSVWIAKRKMIQRRDPQRDRRQHAVWSRY